jgi:bifunctional non-homologous end joining protein LigD
VITHPEKVLFPEDGITKGELAAYYEAIAPVMLPFLRSRPVTMERFPAGIGKPGFMHKDVVKGFPDWLKRVEVPKKGGTTHYPLINDARSLLWLANQNCITAHVWTSRLPNLYHPDLCVFDLDPSVDEPQVLQAAALAVRDLLAELGLPSWVKTSGSKGYHIVVPLDRSSSFDDVAAFAGGVAGVLVQRNPDAVTMEFMKADRGGRIYVDTGRNGYGATVAAAYTVRARPGAPVSAPCTWEEIERGEAAPRSFTLRTMAERMRSAGDLWGDMRRHGRSLGRARAKLNRMQPLSGQPTGASRRIAAFSASRSKKLATSSS